MDRPCLRIIDANFNRAREALRMMEDYCRFGLNNGALSGRLKQLRHELCAAIGSLDGGQLLASRDTLGDVGVGQSVKGQLERTSLAESFTAAAKRLTEALRVLSETIQSHDRGLAVTIERLRYDAYTLEKDIVLFASPAEKFARVRLYVLISNDFPSDVLSLTARCLAGGADCIQLRAKGMPDDRLFALAVEFADMCRQSHALSIINDRADIAIAAGADGVHLGQNDLPIEQVRRLQLTPMVIGRSTHSPKELDRAIASRPAYVSLGPAFVTPTKPGLAVAGLDYVKESLATLADTGVGHVVIGGITRENVDQVIRTGARCVSACSAVTATPDPVQACRRLKSRMVELLGE
jgi:thiamine-phosphate pyrophosphorylase